ncbi:sensor histidine kinase [Phosphitispora fastidiosa]|uniref:sensor histidine kinase n=1 Tax=Phosphitispora fastidiosa TaxID=2837202 RepID=UPI001E5A106B|nr:histidine kinase [Phosphitispora fastidiosa]MBU7006035.1 signal transduction histidine kinase [Phosphitispora fastidiosa]
MDIATHRFFSRILLISLLAGAVLLWFNDHYHALTLVLYALFTALILYHHHQYYTAEQKDPKGKYFLVLELFLALCIQYLDNTGFVEVYFFIVLGDVLLAYDSRFSAPFAAISVICYTGMLFLKSGSVTAIELWREIDATLMLTLIYIAVIVNARYNITISRKNRQLAIMLEETADLRARQKLLHELHDNLGHLLTTAAIGTQAARMLIDKDPGAAKSRLTMITGQIQTAMQSLRNVVRSPATSSEDSEKTLLQSMLILVTETTKLTGICINHNLTKISEDDLSVLNSAQKAYLYNALMEGLTNGIRHGDASQFQFTLSLSENTVHFCLQDNGRGFEQCVLGFGLHKMQQDAERFGADLKLSSCNGCTLKIRVPVTERGRAAN